MKLSPLWGGVLSNEGVLGNSMEIIKKIFTRSFPETVFIEPFFGCNLRCIICLHGKGLNIKREELSPEIFEKIKPLILQAKFLHIAGWGEPFLNPHLYDYLLFLKSLSKPYLLISNGNAIHERYIPLLLNSNSWLAISIDAGDEDTYRNIRKGGNWTQVTSTLKEISLAKKRQSSQVPILELKINVNQNNIDSLQNLPGLCLDLGINIVSFRWTILPENLKHLTPFNNKQRYDTFLAEISSKLTSIGVLVNNNAQYNVRNPGCWNLKPYTFIGANGTVAACCYKWLVIGDLRQNSFDDIWHSAYHRYIHFGILNGKPVECCNTCSKIRKINYSIDEAAFLKEKGEEEEIVKERNRQADKYFPFTQLVSGFQKGTELLLSRQYSDAIKVLSDLSVVYPEYFEIFHNLSLAYCLGGEIHKGIDIYKKRISTIPHPPQIYEGTLKELQS